MAVSADPILTESTANDAPAVVLERVSRLYGNFAALRDVSLELPHGSSVVLLGENGAGKSTLLKILAGLAAPSFGGVTVFGARPLEVRHRLAYMSHATMLYDELTALENLRYFATLHEPGKSVRASSGAGNSTQTKLDPEQALRDVNLDPALDRRVGDYSQGMRQRASLARVLLTSPDLLLLDEPFSNLDAGSVQAMIARLHVYLATPSASGVARTLLLTTHQAELARPLAGLTLTLQAGRVVKRTPSTLTT